MNARTLIAVILPILAITMTPAPGARAALIDGRGHWWQLRLQKLEDERTRIDREGGYDVRLHSVIDGEIARARELVDVFNRAQADSGSLTGETRVWSPSELRREVDAQFDPLFSLYYLDVLVGDTGIRHNDAIAEAKAAARPRIEALTAAAFGAVDADLVARIMSHDISEADWRALALECTAGRYLAGMAAVKAERHARVAAAMNTRLAAAGGRTHLRALRHLITAAVLDDLRGMNPRETLPGAAAALAAAARWRDLEARVRHDLAQAAALRQLPGAPANLAPLRARELYRNPAEAERLLFPAPAALAKGSREGRPGDHDTLAIPPMPDPRGVYDELAQLRKKAIHAITGREGDEYFIEVQQRAAVAVRRHCDDTAAALYREKARFRAAAAPSNPDDFRDAERRYADARASFDADAARTVAFARWLTACRRREAAPVMTAYRYRIERNAAYTAFVRDRCREARGAAQFDAGGAYQRLVMALRKSDPLFVLAGTALNLERDDLAALGKSDLAAVRELRGAAQRELTERRHHCSLACEGYAATMKERGLRVRRAHERLDGTVAQHEITLLVRSAEAWAGLAAGLRYAEEAFAVYVARYRSFEEEARAGTPSPELEEALRQRSLLVNLKGFDRCRLNRETTTRHYARREGDAALSRLSVLTGAYRRQGLRISDVPEAAELAALREKLAANLDVTVADWRLGETTLGEVDRKAAEKLVALYRRAAWARSRQTAADDTDDRPAAPAVSVPVSLKDIGIVFDLPAGWESRTPGAVERQRGVMGAYAPEDGNALVRIIRVPLERDTPGAVTEHWLRRNGSEIIEKKTIRRDGGEIFWARSRDRNRNIIEASTVVRNGAAYIVSAKTAKQHYGRFRDQFAGLLESLQP